MSREDIVNILMEKRPKDFKSKAAAQRTVQGVFDAIAEAVADGQNVTITGFGTFEARDRAPRTARNPQTGETIEVPGKRAPAFKAGKKFKAAVNK